MAFFRNDKTACPPSGGPTFVYSEPVSRSDALKMTLLRLAESVVRSEALRQTLGFPETTQRTDAFKMPTASVAPADTDQRTDLFALPTLKLIDTEKRTDSWAPTAGLVETEKRTDLFSLPVSRLVESTNRSDAAKVTIPNSLQTETEKRSDVATIAVILLNAGTFTIPVPKTGNFLTKIWGIGGNGGAQNVFTGGGGSGGPYAATNSVAFTLGGNIKIVNSALGSMADSYVSSTTVAPTSTAQGSLAKAGTVGGNATGVAAGPGGVGTTTGCIGDTLVKGQDGQSGGPAGNGSGPAGVGTEGAGGVTNANGSQAGGGGGGQALAGTVGQGAIGKGGFTFNV